MAGPKDKAEEQDLDKAYRDGRREAAEDAKRKALEESDANKTRTLTRVKNELKRVTTQPHMPQILVTAVAAGGGMALAMKLQGVIKNATKEWVETEGENIGESTMMRKIVVHGTFPVLGIISMALGLWVFGQKGMLAAGFIGAGAGMLFGSIMGSLLVDDDDDDDEEEGE
jgi:uncharacterized membrane protein YdbT with pleckstrin-like domain